MIITENDIKQVKRKAKSTAIQHTYSGGFITSQQIADKIGANVNTVQKRIKHETADQIIATGLKTRGCKTGWKKHK